MLELNFRRLLNWTSCADSPVGHLVCDLREGYFACFTEDDWQAAKLSTRGWNPKIRLMDYPGWVAVVVPAEGWTFGSEDKLPFNHPLAHLICPRHMVVRLQTALKSSSKDEQNCFIGGLSLALGGKTEAILQVLQPVDGDQPNLAWALGLMKEVLRDRADLKFSKSELALRKLSLIHGTPAEKEHLGALIGKAMPGRGVSREERLLRMDEALEFAFGLLRRARRPVSRCYEALGRGFYEVFGDLTEQGMDLEAHDYEQAIQRFAQLIEQRLRRRRASLKRSHVAIGTPPKRRIGRSFKRRT